MPGAASREGDPLLGGNTSGSESASTGSEPSDGGTRLWQELDQPWPSTFERSISLLSSPIINKNEVELFTKSPKPGSTPLALARRNNLDRGFYTPDTRTVLPRFAKNDSITDSERFDGKSLSKVQSLDFAPKVKFQEQQAAAKRDMAAKEYRAKILAKQQSIDAAKSPGYGREVSMAAKAKKQQQKQQKQTNLDAHGQPIVEEKSTVAQAAFNLANILMGVGLLGLPFAFKTAGVVGGSLCLIIFGFFAWRTTLLIGQELNGDPRPSSFFYDSPFKTPLPPGSSAAARMYPPITSFPDIARNAFGEAGCVALSVILYFELFSCICIFLITMSDHLYQLFPAVPLNVHLIMVAFLSLFAAILLRTPTLLSYLSMVGTVSTVCVCISVVLSAVTQGDMSALLAERNGVTDAAPYHILLDTSGITMTLGLVAYCFSGHAIVPSIYTSMKEPQKFDYMATLTFIGVVCCCLAIGMAGYYMFGNQVADQVTLSMEAAIEAPLLMKALVWLMVVTAYSKVTLTMYPLALGMEEIVAPYLTSEGAIVASSATIKVVVITLALVVALYIPSFSFICALVGMICTMSVSIIFPAMAHLKMFGPRLGLFEKLLDWVFILIGLFMAVSGTIATIMDGSGPT